jgi:cytochrome c oxidase subunit III
MFQMATGSTLLNYDRSQYPIPPKTATIGMWVFLASLTMLFAATMIGYVIIRLTGTFSPGLGSIKTPWTLWLSTIVVLAASATIQMAINAIRRRQKFTFLIFITLGLGVLFCLIQLPALAQLYSDHGQNMARQQQAIDTVGINQAMMQQRDLPSDQRFTPVYGLILTLIVVHALHVVGGLVHLVMITRGAILNHYDYEYYAPVKHAAMYWHFLDIVWIVMFGTILLVG